MLAPVSTTKESLVKFTHHHTPPFMRNVRSLEGTQVAEAIIHAGTDNSTSWGPGIALVYSNRVIKFHLRPGGLSGVNRPVLGLFNGRSEEPNVSGNHKIDLTKPWTLRVRIGTNKLFFGRKTSRRNLETL